MLHSKLECVEVIPMKEPIQHLDAYGEMIFVLTNGHGLKVTKENDCSISSKMIRIVMTEYSAHATHTMKLKKFNIVKI